MVGNGSVLGVVQAVDAETGKVIIVSQVSHMSLVTGSWGWFWCGQISVVLIPASLSISRPEMVLLQTEPPRFFQLLSGIRSLISPALQVLWYITRLLVLGNTNHGTLDSSVCVLLPSPFAGELCDKAPSGSRLLW